MSAESPRVGASVAASPSREGSARALPDTPRRRREGGQAAPAHKSSSAAGTPLRPATNSASATPAKGPAGIVNLWDLAQQQRDADKRNQSEERHMFVCGSKEGGMSTLIRRFLERDDKPKPTVALEYTFGRYAKTGDQRAKDLVHIWELGGGSSLAQLVETPISLSSIRSLAVVLVVDLSKPNAIWHTATTLLTAVQRRVDEVLAEADARGSKVPAYLRKKAWQRYGSEAPPDKDLLQPLAVPLLILGSKYDVFRDFESEKRKIVSRSLRFLAHNYGASLLFVTDREESLMNRCRAMLADLAFRVPYKSTSTAFDHNKPLIVPVGSDALSSIGAPPVSATAATAAGARTPMALWRLAMDTLFPPDASVLQADLPADPAVHPDYREPLVDMARAERDEELARAKKRAERRAREATAANTPSQRSKTAAAPVTP